jgi:hypothetical protein
MTRRVVNQWAKAAGRLVGKLGADYRNHRTLAAPWPRVAHTIVQLWRNVASQGRLAYTPPPKRRPATWNEAASRMRADLYSRMRSRLLDPSTWPFWASHLPRVNLRYVPKRNRVARPVG